MNQNVNEDLVESGLIIFGLENCEPCEILNDVLDHSVFNGIEVKKITFDPLNKDHRKTIRSFGIASFPAILAYQNCVEVKRLYGINVMDSKDNIAKYLDEQILNTLKS